jgi:SAM-dependent methyltransferase
LSNRGHIGGYERLPSLHAEGVMDFLWGVEAFNSTAHASAADARADAILAEAGIAIAEPVSLERAIDLFAHDPVIASRHKAYLDAQRLKMRLVGAALAPQRDRYLDALDAASLAGPGSLALDADFVVPDYARHELHMQPGGYVGDDLAGYIFRHAIVGLYSGHNFQNEKHASIATAVPVPADGKVVRVLELGCGIGQLALALKDRFPDAQVWGIDTSAPMLRYAHLHATKLGTDIHYVQLSAETTRFPDDHFDLVTASGLMHEIAPEATKAMVHEVARVLRPGGIFYPLDFYTAGSGKPAEDAKSRFATWVSARWYHEDWRDDYGTVDVYAELDKAGLQADPNGPARRRQTTPVANMHATKRA